MSQDFPEGALTFSFPDGWEVCRPADTSFYQRHFKSFCGGCKETDFLAFDPSPSELVLWLIEVKDYRSHRRSKELDLVREVALKARDVLAMLPVAALRDNAASPPGGTTQAGGFWRSARSAKQLKVVLHCELPPRPSKLFPGVKDAANLGHKLKQELRPIDPHATFTNSSLARSLPWTVS